MPLQIPLALWLLLVTGLPQGTPWMRFWQAGERTRAMGALESELDSKPEAVELRQQLVVWELQTSRFEAALAHANGLPKSAGGLRGRALYFLTRYEACLEFLRPGDPEELMMRVAALQALGRTQEQDELLPQLRNVFGTNSAEVLLVEGRSLHRRGQYAEAVAAYGKVRELRPLEAEALFGLGQCLVRLQKRDEALELLQAHRRLMPLLDKLDFAKRGVAIAPRSAGNHAALARAWQDLAQFDGHAMDKAQGAYTRATELATEGERVAIALRFARFEFELGRDPGAALKVLGGALNKADDVRLRVRKADYLEQTERSAEALVQLRAALLLRPGDRAIQQRIMRIGAR